jgi:hypothetical protein
MMPEASPRRSLNHFSAEPIEPPYTSAAPMPANVYKTYNMGSVDATLKPPQPMPHSTPATLMKRRGPIRSINHPWSGCTHV